MRASCRAAENPRASGGGGEDCALPLSALSGDVWEFRGVWAFESAAAELHWVTNAELHQLVLWYLIWGEAANLRLLPECLCLVLYCASNALNFEASNSEGGEAGVQGAEAGRDPRVTSEAGFAVTFTPIRRHLPCEVVLGIPLRLSLSLQSLGQTARASRSVR